MKKSVKGNVSADLLRGHTDTIILKILSKGDSYGYDICNQILEKTGKEFELKEATLYSSFRRLEESGCISPYWGNETQGGRRRYYKITAHGKQMLEKNLEDWRFTNKILQLLFEEDI
ncbi:MAG: PadR family transcriptional regulator [Elusimicrobiota bacterium]|jgi:DNA-binding PadR family transcriptional regulator|nr:PadR family transcriptional regulator [Elusimicrobiota bacterium]